MLGSALLLFPEMPLAASEIKRRGNNLNALGYGIDSFFGPDENESLSVAFT